ncbi:amidase [Nocardioides sp. zg-DK7169]|uniref:amidase n=1 Tax=Nocardioides sp. zg-DK7169 TaxID=2736600 RepID=UPI001551C49D|nr:amidase family protein [Nocardioides sp. zg-DK7169]NPC98653.1 amidase [Nocardioides sp. zg-DK7169]
MESVELGDATATAEAVRRGEVSAREVVEAAIARIEELNPALNAVVGTRFDEALAEVDAGLPDGPLRGVPTLVKTLSADVAGLPTTNGSRLFADAVAAQDSELVARYKRAGMVVLGTTNTPELGKNASTEPLLHGPAHNPWDPAYSPGGSSGGSAAAVAAGMVPVAHGNDGGGSIRIPSAMCGLFGLKPSRGRVPAAPYLASLANPTSVHHALTTTVRDSALLLDVSHGRVPGAPFDAPTPSGSFLEAARREPGRLRIGVATEVPDGPATSPECVAATRRTADLLASLGHEVEEVTLAFRYAEMAPWSGVIMGASLVATVEARLAVLGRELRDDDLEPFTRGMYDHYRERPAADVARALQGFERTGHQMGAMFADLDVVLTPVLCQPTPQLGYLDTTDPAAMYERASSYSAYTSPGNVTGAPAMSVPAGLDSRGLPIGAHFFTDLGGEELLLSLAAQLEQAAPWPTRAP